MKYFLILVAIVLNATGCKSQNKMTIIYVYDALCGWCYGFSPVITQFYEKNKDSYTFDVVSGGMIKGDRVGQIGEVASYISWAYKDVENATGVRFGKNFLDNTLKKGEAIFTSIPTAIALSVFKTLDLEHSFQFSVELQKAIYHVGIAPEDLSAYGRIATRFGLDADSFVQKMKDPIYLELAKKDFKKSIELGVTGFPSVLLETNGEIHKISSGYCSLEDLEKKLLQIIEK